MIRLPWTRSVARAAFLVSTILALYVSSASAQYGGGGTRVELTPFGGWYIASDLYTSTNAQIGIGDNFMYGGRLGIFPKPHLGIEFSYGRASSNLELINYRAGSFPNNTPLGSLTTDQWDGNLIFAQPKLGNPHATGFFTIGAGVTTFDVNTRLTSGSASSTRFAWNFGIGSKWDVSDKVALRIDGRYRAADTNINTSSGLYCDYYGFCYNYSSSWYSTGEISAGLAYRLK